MYRGDIIPGRGRRLAGVVMVAALMVMVRGAAAQPAAPTDARVVDLPNVAGQRLLYLSPPHPRATVVMLPGGAGDVGIGPNGEIAHGNNFLVRSRALWVAKGFAVVIPDAVDHANLRGLRSKPRYADIVGAFVAFAHAQASGPVFLIGTSQGAIAAMNGAAHLRHGEIAGVVLTESVSRLGGSHETVFDAHPDQVNVPALVVANGDDRCKVAPPQDAETIAAAMTHAPRVKVLKLTGGTQQSARDCGSLSPHGYFGIEASVVDAIAAWMQERI